jgi:hypothetical protein
MRTVNSVGDIDDLLLERTTNHQRKPYARLRQTSGKNRHKNAGASDRGMMSHLSSEKGMRSFLRFVGLLTQGFKNARSGFSSGHCSWLDVGTGSAAAKKIFFVRRGTSLPRPRSCACRLTGGQGHGVSWHRMSRSGDKKSATRWIAIWRDALFPQPNRVCDEVEYRGGETMALEISPAYASRAPQRAALIGRGVDADEARSEIAALRTENAELRKIVIELSKLVIRNVLRHGR